MMFTVPPAQEYGEEDTVCVEGSPTRPSRQRQETTSFLSRLWSPGSSNNQHEGPAEDNKTGEVSSPRPTAAAVGPSGIASGQGSSRSTARQRIEHQTQVPVGDKNSRHYGDLYPAYTFPLLGRVSEGYGLVPSTGSKGDFGA